jgi:hypothetical protein
MRQPGACEIFAFMVEMIREFALCRCLHLAFEKGKNAKNETDWTRRWAVRKE